jgi:predicted Rossmann-fold nucleotide-binding protein
MKMIKIGIVGSRKWKNKNLIQDAVDQCLARYGNQLTVVSGGAKGADSLGRQVALEKGLKYIEYNPAHEAWNEYSGKPKDWYGKEYKVGNFFERNTFIAEDSDILFAFIPDGHQSNGTMDTVEKARKLKKWVVIVTETTVKVIQ